MDHPQNAKPTEAIAGLYTVSGTTEPLTVAKPFPFAYWDNKLSYPTFKVFYLCFYSPQSKAGSVRAAKGMCAPAARL